MIKKIPQEKHISPEKRQRNIDKLGLIWYNNGISQNNKIHTKII